MDKQDIELKFYNVLRSNEKMDDFENWVYDADEKLINQYLGEGFYFDLASLNYKNKYIMNELEKLLSSKVPFGRFEQLKISHLLNGIIRDESHILELLDELYDLYCNGYIFLRNLGLTFAACTSYGDYQTYKLDDKTKAYFKSEAHRILSYLDSGKIIITDEYEYDDKRAVEEMIELYDSEKNVTVKKGILQTIFNKIYRTIR